MHKISIGFRKEIYKDFFISQFSFHTKTVEISRKKEIGKYVYSLIKYSDIPLSVNFSDGTFLVDIILPEVSGSTASNKFCYISKEDQIKINDHVEAVFDLIFKQYLIFGHELKLNQKKIVELFLEAYNLDPGKHAGLIKKDYRSRCEIKNKIKELAQVAYS